MENALITAVTALISPTEDTTIWPWGDGSTLPYSRLPATDVSALSHPVLWGAGRSFNFPGSTETICGHRGRCFGYPTQNE